MSAARSCCTASSFATATATLEGVRPVAEAVPAGRIREGRDEDLRHNPRRFAGGLRPRLNRISPRWRPWHLLPVQHCGRDRWHGCGLPLCPRRLLLSLQIILQPEQTGAGIAAWHLQHQIDRFPQSFWQARNERLELCRVVASTTIPDVEPFVGRMVMIDGELHRVVAPEPQKPGMAIIGAGDRRFSTGIETLRRQFGKPRAGPRTAPSSGAVRLRLERLRGLHPPAGWRPMVN
jgi:hypothetical protein